MLYFRFEGMISVGKNHVCGLTNNNGNNKMSTEVFALFHVTKSKDVLNFFDFETESCFFCFKFTCNTRRTREMFAMRMVMFPSGIFRFTISFVHSAE